MPHKPVNGTPGHDDRSTPSNPKGNGEGTTLNAEQMQRMEEVIGNVLSIRSEILTKLFDPRRDIDDECGYPSTERGLSAGSINPEFYRNLYDRECIATRVVQVFPKESWQVSPTVYEDEDTKNVTEFENAWDELSQSLRGERSWYQDERGSPIWEHLKRADILSGIGHFGIILLGIDDGKNLDQPVDGVATYIPGHDVRATAPQSINPLDTRSSVLLEKMGIGVGGTSPLPHPEQGLGNPTQSTQPNTVLPTSPTAPHVGVSIPDPVSGITGTEGQYEQELDRISPFTPYGPFATPFTGSPFSYPGSAIGTDSQYTGVQLGPPEYASTQPSQQKRKLLFIRTFDESLVQIVQYESDVRNSRFGRPVMYRITLNDPREFHSGIGLPMATVRVHWSRVIHLADNLGSSEIFGVPRMRPVLNRLLDLRKLYSGSAEMYWRGAFPGISLETNPQLGGDVVLDKQGIRDMMEQYMNGLQRYLALMGMTAKTLSPQVVDPGTQIQVQIEAICIELGIPVRVFKGSERGELASSQDDEAWNDRLRERQDNYITPRIIIPFVDRLISMGVLPQPKGFSVHWPELDSLSASDKSTIAATRTTAMQTYIAGNVESIITPLDYLTRILGFSEEEATVIVDSAKEHQTSAMTMPPEGEQGHPTSSPLPPTPPTPVVPPTNSPPNSQAGKGNIRNFSR